VDPSRVKIALLTRVAATGFPGLPRSLWVNLRPQRLACAVTSKLSEIVEDAARGRRANCGDQSG
jgi:hypothetical protein